MAKVIQDEGVRLAIEAAGGLRPLARALGVSAPSILKWTNIPAHRVVQIEMTTKIERERLRPDLYRTKCKGGDDGADQRKVRPKMDNGLQAAIEKAGSRYALAKVLGLTTAPVQRWRRI